MFGGEVALFDCTEFGLCMLGLLMLSMPTVQLGGISSGPGPCCSTNPLRSLHARICDTFVTKFRQQPFFLKQLLPACCNRYSRTTQQSNQPVVLLPSRCWVTVLQLLADACIMKLGCRCYMYDFVIIQLV